MRWVRLFLVTLFFAVIALRYPPDLLSRGIGSSWLLLPVLALGFAASPGRAAALGWAIGLLADLLSLEPFGVHAFAYGAAAFLLARTRGFFFHEHALTQAGMGFVLAFVTGLVLLLRLELAEPALAMTGRLMPLIGLSLGTALLLPVLVTVHRRTGMLGGFGGPDVSS